MPEVVYHNKNIWTTKPSLHTKYLNKLSEKYLTIGKLFKLDMQMNFVPRL